MTVGRSLHNMWTIAKEEFKLYWFSPVAYFVGAIWLGFGSLFFVFVLEQLQAFNPFGGATEPSMSVPLRSMTFLLIFLAPALTMRLISEEIRSGTHELLMTSPIRDWEIVVGKWLGVWGVFTVFILVSLIHPLILIWRGSPDTGLLVTGYLGYWLWAGAALAIGVLASAITQFQLIAYIMGLVGTLSLLLIGAVSDIISSLITGLVPDTAASGLAGTVADVINQLSVRTHYDQTLASRGLIDIVDIAYFVGLIAICLFLATQMLSSRRWRA